LSTLPAIALRQVSARVDSLFRDGIKGHKRYLDVRRDYSLPLQKTVNKEKQKP